MPRKRIYADATARQRAYRARLQERLQPQYVPPPPRPARRPSRPARLTASLAALNSLQDEYEQWLEAMPEALRSSPLGERLIDTIEQLQAASDLLEGIDLPRGFGRD
jgi:hypothetical protein